ncbi:DUF4226 domain-containing protein [Mycolicibacter hiberniae]|uniref:Uncharacterized protein n=1 Tax=Mycolicibacter hiberniae TaxID=29314 RepID=A0A7I7X7X7_9MYCO|nr:DUF4226 domain-containing protein [Mycolicibacter hiberniae]MCV7085058.1 DUF4226 domain-containing protein [Mycolicibacter hiberniae]ORV68689.1 hypothetical protein AWC09_15170 [Mycolicibacter hiberniae]BBZ25345.1 hypothetical protein MHIB_37630 [Mycolicibacter hiberniae]
MAENPGTSADASRARHDALARQLAASAAADQEFQTLLRQAVQSNADARQRLDAIEAEVRESAETWPGLDTPAGSRQFQRFLTAKTHEVHRVVSDAATDNQHRAQQARALTRRYQLAGGDGEGLSANT